MSYFEKIFFRPQRNKKSNTEFERPRGLSVSSNEQELGGGDYLSERRPDQKLVDQQLCAGFDTILDTLKHDPKKPFSQRIEQLKSMPDYDGILGHLDQYFTPDHWEMVAVLEAYDKRTFDHSLRVAAFVYEMTSGGGETESYIKTKVAMEQGSLEELFTAALFHDIGKTAIPNAILHDNHSRREWAKRANDWATKNNQDYHFDPQHLDDLGEVELDYYFMKVHALNGSDPLNIVPLEEMKEIFTPDILKELEQHGISPHDTFKKVLECHEKSTGAILRLKKMYTASDIASHHHDYERRPIRTERYPTEESAVRIGFELSILRSMDVYDALTSDDRSYKEPYSPLLALEILIKEAKIEFTELELTKRVIRDLYNKLESSQEATPKNDVESLALQKILAFIA